MVVYVIIFALSLAAAFVLGRLSVEKSDGKLLIEEAEDGHPKWTFDITSGSLETIPDKKTVTFKVINTR